MSKKNSNVNLKSGFKKFQGLSETYNNFKKKLDNLRKSSAVVAVSGGPDSLALAAFTKAYTSKKKIKFYYVLIDHKIRKNSTKEANQVKNLLKKYQIKLNIISNKRKINNNIQSEARNIRYNLLTEFCIKKKVKVILTAHNLEDQVETFFIRLSRGSGLTGLSAMKSMSKINHNIHIYRPLLNTKKKYLIKTSKFIFGKFFKDPSNKNKKYLRTKIRNLKEPLKQSGINYDQIIKSINNLALSRDTLNQYFIANMKNSIKKSKNKINVDLKKFNQFNKELKIRVINDSIRYLRKNYYNPRSKKVVNLIKNIDKKNFSKATLGGCIFTKKNDQLCLSKEKT